MARQSTSSQRRGWSSVGKLRRKLRNMGDKVEKNIRPALEIGIQNITMDMRGLTPVNEGVAATEIDFSISRDGLTAKAGLIDKASIRAAFYFAFLDGGTKGSPENNVPPMQALHIRDRAFDANSEGMKRDIRAGIKNALAEAARE